VISSEACREAVEGSALGESFCNLGELGYRGSAVAPPFLSPKDAAQLRANARAEDAGNQSIASSVELLRSRGWLADAVTICGAGRDEGADTELLRRGIRMYMTLAEANLSIARLYEGHVNALRLVLDHADKPLALATIKSACDGALLGVWGADAGEPVALASDTRHLVGQKRFASGLGVVSQAVVTARNGDSVQLCLVDVRDQTPADPGTWCMSGMRATASGTYDFSLCQAVAIQPFGAPDCFHKEPTLFGGVWRIAAIQLGGIYGLLEAARAQLASLDRLDDLAQIARLTPLVYRAEAAAHLVEAAALYAEGPGGIDSPERAVAQSVFARLLTEALAQDTIAVVERSIGLAHFDTIADTGRMARDLATYIRQVAPDGLLQRSGREVLLSTDSLRELFRA